MNIFLQFKKGLEKTSNFLSTSIHESIRTKNINQETLEELESILISADISLDVTSRLTKCVKNIKVNDNNAKEVLTVLAREIETILKPKEKNLLEELSSEPTVLIFIGVNGSGKTTTIGKIAKQIPKQNKILIAACDTFRAAAVDQLKSWAIKNNNDFFQGKLEQDPASVAFAAAQKFRYENYDYLLVDTAGRLSNNTNLVNQLIKIKNVIGKTINESSIKTLLVLDGTNGSNMIKQAEKFGTALDISGIIITKLDGTAKGGALISIANKYEIPITFVGLGEKDDDLEIFNAKKFSRSIFNLEEVD
jgi:fused signal recognition particle receptor